MSNDLNRRKFLMAMGLMGACATTATAGYHVFLKNPKMAMIPSKTKPRIVVIGGGAGGTIAAKYIRMADPNLQVTLIEQNQNYYSCFMSNEVLGGNLALDAIKFSYDQLSHQYGIKMLYERALSIDPVAKKVNLPDGKTVQYDRLILSPGIDFNWEAIEGYDEKVATQIPHAWKSSAQIRVLRKQLEAMPDGGTVIITVPPKPFRCPPGPYERASQMAHYLKHHKPKSKIVILDSNQAFSKQALFTQGWEQLYGFGTDHSLIEWVPLEEGGNLVRVDADNLSAITGEFEDAHKAAVLNVIPPQIAGRIAIESGLANDQGWCPVNPQTFESTLHKDIHIIGDASVARPMPKSAQAANSQAKVCAAAVVSALQGQEMPKPSYGDTCYSIVGEDFGISVTAVYQLVENKIQLIEGAGGQSPLDASAEDRKREVIYAYSWFKNIVNEMFS